MTRILTWMFFLSLLLHAVPARAGDELEKAFSVIPAPVKLVHSDGVFTLEATTRILVDTGPAAAVGHYLAEVLGNATGDAILVEQTGASSTSENTIRLTIVEGNEALGPEGYELSVSPTGIVVRARQPAGLFYGVQTLRQFLPPEMETRTAAEKITTWNIPCVQIEDRPRFPWRGLLIDCSRTFWSVDYLKRTIRLMSLYKLNRLHLHLTDDQGWRVEIKQHPRLTEFGSKFLAKYNEPPERQGFYSQAEIKELVAYGIRHNVTIVPEIEMPGHSLAILATYPELSCTGGPFEIHPFFQGPGIHKDILCAGNERTFEVLRDVLEEVCHLFPSEFIHIGGDEAPKHRWKACAKCQARIEDEGLKDEHELQSYFVKRIEKFLNDKGKRLIGWDEILEGGLAPNAAVMSWRGIAGGIAAAQAGHDAVMSPTSHCYFDYPYARISTKRTYSYEPVPEALTSAEAQHILGAQANFWSHIDRTEAGVDKQLFPRLLALAEVVWSPKELRDWENFSHRLEEHCMRLGQLGVRYHIEFIPADRRPTLARPGSLTSTSGTWKNYHLEYAFDGDPKTYYWNDRAIKRDDSVTLVLENPYKLTRVEVHTGIPDIVAARLAHGVLEVSKDGNTFTKLADFHNGVAKAELEDQLVKAIRIRAVAHQGPNWLMVREIVLESGVQSSLRTIKPIEPFDSKPSVTASGR
ncbi:MAG: family 20 glycosylhydrolase [Planctomycetes bacterium]|nr:family 20 glycosylhydrolase [Planctomycetota bacterium]MBL7037029.1 family 20 glycosylhydrolase [Pirellulaceae bacterium]